MIQIQDVSFEYEKEQGTLSHIDLNIKQGECVVLTGESGCGKTTVTKLINGLIPHFVEGGTLSGTTIVNGMEVPKTEMYRLAEQVGSVFQNPKSQFFNIDSDSEITFGLENAGVEPKKIKERYEATVSALKIQSLLGRNIFSMSGGEKQSLAFASVYAMNPSVFVLDEPTANLDADAIDALHDISLKMPQGSFTALVGPSGGGKSTVARLIARFWDVTGGSISIGGTNIKELSVRQLSELVSFVTQDNFLFNCSLKENIRLGNPNATDEEVYAAAKAACCDDFIVRLEKGYDTPAGDAGKRLSGGEKQRIAIARAILKNAPIVILDEATAFTDPQNEDKIQKSIMALSKGKTLLVIAHRLSTIQNADQIVVLKKGQIVDCGKQEELLERCPLYADMWQAHIGAKNWSVGEKKEVAVNV